MIRSWNLEWKSFIPLIVFSLSKQYCWKAFHLAKKNLKKCHSGVVIDAHKAAICAEFCSKDTSEVIVAKMLVKIGVDVFLRERFHLQCCISPHACIH